MAQARLLLSVLWWMTACHGSGSTEPTGPQDTASTPSPIDLDHDGSSTEQDCDDLDPDVFPGATERCDGIDQDCDGQVDDGVITDGAGCAVPESPAPPTVVSTLHAIVQAGTEGWSDDAENPYRLCVDATHCMPLSHPGFDDLIPGNLDTFSAEFPGVPIASLDRVQVRPPTGAVDDVRIACLQVVVDGHTAFCEQDLGSIQDGYAEVLTLAPTCRRCGPALVNGPMVGETTPTTARIWWQTNDSALSELRIAVRGTDPALQAPVASRYASAARDHTVEVRLDGLVPDTNYDLQLSVAGEVRTGSFRTAPVGPGQWRFAYGSCAKLEDTLTTAPFWEQPIFDSIVADEPDLFLYIGDSHYANSSDLSTLRRHNRTIHGLPGRAALEAQTPTVAVWDDHDFVGNDADGNAGRPAVALRAFKESWARESFGLPGLDGVFGTLQWGDVEFFLLDTRMQRHVLAPDDFLGAGQTTWLQDALVASDATFKLLVTSSQLTTEGRTDSWGGHSTEQRALVEFIAREEIEGVVVLSGDVHRAEFRRLPGGVGGYTIPEWTSSPLSNAILEPCDASLRSNEREVCLRGLDYYIRVDVDTLLTDPTLTATLVDVTGTERAVWTVTRSELVNPVRVPAHPDFDGDGYADLVLGVPDEAVGATLAAGVVTVFPGTSLGPHTRNLLNETAADLGRPVVTDARFGSAVAFGDFNADGFDDLAIGSPGTQEVLVQWGDTGGLGSVPQRLGSTGVGFGTALAAGDFDGDGTADLAVGDPGAARVGLFLGAPSGLQAWVSLDSETLGVPTSAAEFGAALVAGDFDGDLVQDLVVGAPGGTEAVVVVHGGLGGMGSPMWFGATELGHAGAAGDGFGSALAAGDVDGDGIFDLVIGSPGASDAAWIPGGPSGLELAGSIWLAGSMLPTERFGASVLVADLDLDGHAEILVGAPGRLGGGGVDVITGGVPGALTSLGSPALFEASFVPEGFGSALRAADYDADGWPDVVVGIPLGSVDGIPGSGAVVLFHNGPAGLDDGWQRWHQDLAAVPGSVEVQDHVGSAL